MSKLAATLGATLLLAASVAPALAAPAHAVVHGATPLYEYTPGYSYDGDAGGTDYGFHGNPQDRYYDPTGVIPDTRYYGPPAVDLILARTLDVRNESLLGHVLKCEARYPSYSAASNFYTGPDGLPAVCYL